jgi:hypothetical protein
MRFLVHASRPQTASSARAGPFSLRCFLNTKWSDQCQAPAALNGNCLGRDLVASWVYDSVN